MEDVELLARIFECTCCGYCCQGETTVSLNEDDRWRMAVALAMSEDEVRKEFWRVTDGVVQMKTVDGHCIFYDNGCRVHTGRPWRCAQWPLHPAILGDENNFRTISESCPGIKKDVSYAEFCKILEKLMLGGVISC